MLILTRQFGETIHIGDDVTVTILGVKPHQVRIGINAPKDVPVHREEIYRRIKEERHPGAVSEHEPKSEQGTEDRPDAASGETFSE